MISHSLLHLSRPPSESVFTLIAELNNFPRFTKILPQQLEALHHGILQISSLTQSVPAWKTSLSFALREFLFRSDWVTAVTLVPRLVGCNIGSEEHWVPVAIRTIGLQNWSKALEMFSFMNENHASAVRGGQMYGAIIKTLAMHVSWEHSVEAYKRMLRAGIPPDVHTIGTLTKALEKGGRWCEAFHLVSSHGIQRHKVIPSTATYVCLLHALATHIGRQGESHSHHLWTLALRTFSHMRWHHRATTESCNALVRAFALTGKVDLACVIVQRYENFKVLRDHMTWSYLLQAFNIAGQWERVLQTSRSIPSSSSHVHSAIQVINATRIGRRPVQDMVYSFSQVNAVGTGQLAPVDERKLYNALFHALRTQGAWEQCIRFWTNSKIPMDCYAYEHIFEVLELTNRWEDSIRLLKSSTRDLPRSECLKLVPLATKALQLSTDGKTNHVLRKMRKDGWLTLSATWCAQLQLACNRECWEDVIQYLAVIPKAERNHLQFVHANRVVQARAPWHVGLGFIMQHLDEYDRNIDMFSESLIHALSSLRTQGKTRQAHRVFDVVIRPRGGNVPMLVLQHCFQAMCSNSGLTDDVWSAIESLHHPNSTSSLFHALLSLGHWNDAVRVLTSDVNLAPSIPLETRIRAHVAAGSWLDAVVALGRMDRERLRVEERSVKLVLTALVNNNNWMRAVKLVNIFSHPSDSFGSPSLYPEIVQILGVSGQWEKALQIVGESSDCSDVIAETVKALCLNHQPHLASALTRKHSVSFANLWAVSLDILAA
eukprot:PhF_6_TR21143/c0_g1_i1/m.30416